jgi:uncharacterized protein with ATP-grasp and redox domains
MKTYFDCIPCFVRQALDSARLLCDDETLHEQVLRRVLGAAAEMDLRRSPAEMAQQIHRWIRELTGDPDPYLNAKRHSNRLALDLYPTLKEWVDRSNNRLATAVRLAIAGNIIDLGVKCDVTEGDVHNAVRRALAVRLEGDVDELARAVDSARRILYLADNAGEIVFDRVLIEELPREKITLAVKGGPIINDALLEDAEAAGLAKLVEVIDDGSDAPGTILEDCSAAFRGHFDSADLIIAKGQANYETLSDPDTNVWFLLMAKCPVIARDLRCRPGTLVLRNKRPAHA